jgi:hypothetical protein
VHNDAPPIAYISDATVSEGNSRTVDVVFAALLLVATDKRVTVKYSTVDDTLVAPAHYTGIRAPSI